MIPDYNAHVDVHAARRFAVQLAARMLVGRAPEGEVVNTGPRARSWRALEQEQTWPRYNSPPYGADMRRHCGTLQHCLELCCKALDGGAVPNDVRALLQDGASFASVGGAEIRGRWYPLGQLATTASHAPTVTPERRPGGRQVLTVNDDGGVFLVCTVCQHHEQITRKRNERSEMWSYSDTSATFRGWREHLTQNAHLLALDALLAHASGGHVPVPIHRWFELAGASAVDGAHDLHPFARTGLARAQHGLSGPELTAFHVYVPERVVRPLVWEGEAGTEVPAGRIGRRELTFWRRIASRWPVRFAEANAWAVAHLKPRWIQQTMFATVPAGPDDEHVPYADTAVSRYITEEGRKALWRRVLGTSSPALASDLVDPWVRKISRSRGGWPGLRKSTTSEGEGET